MANELAGKVIFITGVSQDGQVGQAVAQMLAAQGAQLAIAARRGQSVEARAEELRKAGAKVLALAVDLTLEDQVRQAVANIDREYGRIDVLVNLAGGLTCYKPVIEHSITDWTHELNNNLLSTFLCARAAFPIMRDRGGGSIINFSRAGAAQANMAAYNCAKAGIEALTRTLALEGRDHKIRANAIAPGLVDTASNVAVMKPKDLKNWTKREDIAKAVSFLAGDESAGITGQVIAVAGWGI